MISARSPLGVRLGLVDREFQLGGRDAHAAGKRRVELQPAGVEHEALAFAVAADGDALGRAGATVGGVHEIAAGREVEDAGAALGRGDQRELAVRPGLRPKTRQTRPREMSSPSSVSCADSVISPGRWQRQRRGRGRAGRS